MKLRRLSYVAHRWLALIVALQLLAWSVGGFMFSVLHIEDVRGETDATSTESASSDIRSVRVTIDDVIRTAHETGFDMAGVRRVTLIDRGLGPRYELADQDGIAMGVVDAISGAVVRAISADEAGRLALADFAPEATIIGIERIEESDHYEYRSKPLPAFRVTLAHARRPHIYVNALTGEITARRNRSWRIFDFFWMLHIMDYGSRSDFNHPLLTGFSALAVLTSVSGIVLWLWRVAPRKKHDRSATTE